MNEKYCFSWFLWISHYISGLVAEDHPNSATFLHEHVEYRASSRLPTRTQNLGSGHQRVPWLSLTTCPWGRPWGRMQKGHETEFFKPLKNIGHWKISLMPFPLNFRVRAYKGLRSPSTYSLIWRMERLRPREGKGLPEGPHMWRALSELEPCSLDPWFNILSIL